MPGTILPIVYDVGFPFGHIRLLLDRAERCFRRPRNTVSHILRVSSRCAPVDHAPTRQQTRIVPCAWGVRRDEFRWRGGRGERECAELRRGTSIMGRMLVDAPLPGWRELLPGSMAEMMGRQSDLYLTDYWLLVLHYLVWCGRLPYPVKARWTRGSSVHDDCFEFISELPTGLAEASVEALILFREAAVPPSTAAAGPAHPSGPLRSAMIEPPVFRDGRWHMGCDCDMTLAAEKPIEVRVSAALRADAGGPITHPELPPSESEASPKSDRLELDNQCFTIHFGGRSCRIPPRSEQLFALLERISRRPDHQVRFEDLCSPGDVWDGLSVEDSTIRGAVARLRKLLREHGMDALAERISTGTYQRRPYVMLRRIAETDE